MMTSRPGLICGAFLLLGGCTPKTNTVGDTLPTAGSGTDTGTGDEDGSSANDTGSDSGLESSGESGVDPGGDGPPGEFPWSVGLKGIPIAAFSMAANASGVVVVSVDLDGPSATWITKYSPDGTLLWQLEFDAAVHDIWALPDGRFVAGGAASVGTEPTGRLWLLSCCGVVEQTIEYALGTHVVNVLADDTQIYAVSAAPTGARLQAFTLGLVEQWAVDGPPHQVEERAITPAGDLVFLELEVVGSTPHFRLHEYATDGTDLGTTSADFLLFAGSGANLSMVHVGEEALSLQAYGAATSIPLDIEPVKMKGYAARAEKIVYADSTNVGSGVGGIVYGIDDDGANNNTWGIPPSILSDGSPAGVAVAPDGSFYVSLWESDIGTNDAAASLTRISP